MGCFSVEGIVKKICSRCNISKNQSDYYICQGRVRSECKKCTIKKNVTYQKRTQAWKNRFLDSNEHRTYMADYYLRNKEKFAEYRRKFMKKYPNYYKEYARQRKNVGADDNNPN